MCVFAFMCEVVCHTHFSHTHLTHTGKEAVRYKQLSNSAWGQLAAADVGLVVIDASKKVRLQEREVIVQVQKPLHVGTCVCVCVRVCGIICRKG
jgi:hypothetical protein